MLLKLLLTVTLFLVTGSTAQAHYMNHKKHMTLAHKISYFKHSIEHDEQTVTWFSRVRKNLRRNLSALAESRYEFAVGVQRELTFHKKALRWHKALLSRYQARWDKLHPPLPPHYSQWLCIHRYEGSWTDSGSPYYGGLQMDIAFQTHYGASLLATKGTADHWSPLEQMWVAERAYSSGRGFGPWPNTARSCGLL